MSTYPRKDVPWPFVQAIESRWRNWRFWYQAYSAINVLLLVAILIGTAIAASELSGAFREKAALFVAICLGLYAVIQPDRKARLFRLSWMELDLKLKALNGENQDLLFTIAAGEKRVGEISDPKQPVSSLT